MPKHAPLVFTRPMKQANSAYHVLTWVTLTDTRKVGKRVCGMSLTALKTKTIQKHGQKSKQRALNIPAIVSMERWTCINTVACLLTPCIVPVGWCIINRPYRRVRITSRNHGELVHRGNFMTSGTTTAAPVPTTPLHYLKILSGWSRVRIVGKGGF